MSILRSVKALPIALFALVPAAAHACDALVGTYALKARGVATLNIAKTPSGYALSRREGEGADSAWTLLAPSMRTATSAQLRAGGGVGVDIGPKSCGLAAKGALFLKVKVGASYQDNTSTGQNSIETRKSKSAYLLYEAQGMMAGGTDLYRVPFTGKVAPMPVEMAKAVRGHEVPVAPLCPGQRLPDMTQASFNALSSTLRDEFARRPAQAQRNFVCGQRLNNMTTVHGYIGASSDTSDTQRAATLVEVRALLDAGQVPRDESGKANWWQAINHVAASFQLTDNTQAVPLRDEYYALLQAQLLPRAMPVGVGPDTEAARGADDFIGRVVSMPQPIAMALLLQLKAMGATRWQSGDYGNQNNAMINLERTLKSEVPIEVFDLMLGEAGDAALVDYSILNAAVVKQSRYKVARLLEAGLNPMAAPARFEVMERAQKYGNAEIYQLLKENIERRGGKAPPYVQAK